MPQPSVPTSNRKSYAPPPPKQARSDRRILSDDCVIALELANKARHAFSQNRSIAIFSNERTEPALRVPRRALMFR